MAAEPCDWQLRCTELKHRGSQLLQSGQWSDCSFLVGSEPHQVVVPGHKLILAMASPVFEAMFYGGMAERNEPIPILDVQPEAFKALLEYIYTDNINISSFDKACELCYGAKKYMLPYLVKECTRYLWSDLYPRNACRAYEFARLFEESVLMDKCLQIISTNTKEVLTDSSFEEVELNTVMTVFSLDHLNIDSELDLFEAAVRYAKAQDRRQPEQTPGHGSPKPATSTEKEIELNTVMTVFSLDHLNIDSELDLFEAAVRYAKAQDRRQPEQPPGPASPKPATSTEKGVELNTVMTVFSLDHLNIDSELDLFEAAVRYAKAQDRRQPEQPPGPGSPKPATSTEKVVVVESSAESSPQDAGEGCARGDCREPEPGPSASEAHARSENKLTIRNAIEKIRFLTLTPQQFAEGPARSALLTESEAFAVLMNILSARSDVAMPQGFSTCRVPRKQLIGSSNNMPTFTVDTPSPVMVEHVERPPPLALSCPRPRHEGMRLGTSVHVLGPDHLERHSSDFNKIYCQRPILQHTDCLNTSGLDCSVTFMVDKNICLLGVQVPTQAPSEESAVSALGGTGYSELLYAHLLDADGARLTYTHYTSRVPYRHLLDIMFNRPVYIQRNKVYKVGIVFNKVGWYPMGSCAQQVAAESVFFNFGIGQSSDSVRDGLIRSIIFTH